MNRRGAKSEEIRQKTGWFKGYDGKWRYEIDDSKMEFLGVEVDKETTLGEVIKHDELFEAYPELREVRFIVDSSLNDKGYYDYKNNLIKIPANLVSDASLDIKLKKLLIHEIQHAIQGIEGFAKGGSWSEYERELYKEKKLKIAAASTASKIYLRKIEKRFGKYGVQVTNDYYDLIKHPDTEEDYFNDLKELEQELKEDGMFELVSKYVHAKLTMIGEAQGVSLEAWDKYEKTAGEIEAYDVADRLNFTPEQRKNTRPDVDQDKVFFADDSHLNSVSEGVGYDYTKAFSEQIDDYKGNKFPKNDTLLVGATPDIWKKVGFNSLPVTINQTHVDYALNGTKDIDHHLGEALLKDLPNAIQNPIAIIQSQSPRRPDRAVVILKMKHNGTNVIGAIEVDGQGITNKISIDSNAMTSPFAKTNILTQLNKAINNTVNGKVALFYWDKKEAITLLQNKGLQLSKTLPQDGFIHSIRDKGSLVNMKFKNVTETQQFKRWFGDWQNNAKKASKVVNADGTPKILYHQTGEEFDEFDTSKIGSATDDGGGHIKKFNSDQAKQAS